jgi:hypothetical protein
LSVSLELTTSLSLLNTRLTTADIDTRTSWESQLSSVADHHRERMLHIVAYMKELQQQQQQQKEKMDAMLRIQREMDERTAHANKQGVVHVEVQSSQNQQQMVSEQRYRVRHLAYVNVVSRYMLYFILFHLM